jgi:hypothetical protein
VTTFVSYRDALSDLKHPFVSIRSMLKTAARHKSKPLALEAVARASQLHTRTGEISESRATVPILLDRKCSRSGSQGRTIDKASAPTSSRPSPDVGETSKRAPGNSTTTASLPSGSYLQVPQWEYVAERQARKARRKLGLAPTRKLVRFLSSPTLLNLILMKTQVGLGIVAHGCGDTFCRWLLVYPHLILKHQLVRNLLHVTAQCFSYVVCIYVCLDPSNVVYHKLARLLCSSSTRHNTSCRHRSALSSALSAHWQHPLYVFPSLPSMQP